MRNVTTLGTTWYICVGLYCRLKTTKSAFTQNTSIIIVRVESVLSYLNLFPLIWYMTNLKCYQSLLLIMQLFLILNKNCATAKILSHALGLEFIVPRNSNI